MDKQHQVKIVLESSSGGLVHQRITVEEGAETPEELVWKYREIVGGVLNAFDGMIETAATGTIPWDVKKR
jgi:hypothetical protein